MSFSTINTLTTVMDDIMEEWEESLNNGNSPPQVRAAQAAKILHRMLKENNSSWEVDEFVAEIPSDALAFLTQDLFCFEVIIRTFFRQEKYRLVLDYLQVSRVFIGTHFEL